MEATSFQACVRVFCFVEKGEDLIRGKPSRLLALERVYVSGASYARADGACVCCVFFFFF
jgi:hypothetical protein